MISAQLVMEGKEPRTVDMPKLRASGKPREDIRAQSWQCKFCARPMTPRMGAVREWYFAHQREASECPFEAESEPESETHRALKRAAGEGLRAHFGKDVESLEYEVRFPELRRIADAVLTLKDGARVAVEAQLSPLTIEKLQQRTQAYVQGEVEVVWVFLESKGRAGNWDALRAWLLDEGHLVMTAKAVVTERHVPLPTLPK